jgi:DivIVA domain-containing protein
MSPDGQAQARAVYVVQRTFRLVRRGYDPAEVDRHLHLVNEWFTTSGPGREAETIRAQARRQAEEDREQLLAASRTETDQLARKRHEQAEKEADAYVKRRQREIDRLVMRERDGRPA